MGGGWYILSAQQRRNDMAYNLGDWKNELAIERSREDSALLREGGMSHLTGKARRDMIKLIRSEIAADY
jgi:hypothetical protein